MRKLVVPFLLFCQFVVAQVIEGGAFAVINDKDGYVNVRSKPSTSSKVLVELDNNDYVTRHPDKTVGDWYYVDFDADGGAPALAQGYIHKSQLKKYKE